MRYSVSIVEGHIQIQNQIGFLDSFIASLTRVFLWAAVVACCAVKRQAAGGTDEYQPCLAFASQFLFQCPHVIHVQLFFPRGSLLNLNHLAGFRITYVAGVLALRPTLRAADAVVAKSPRLTPAGVSSGNSDRQSRPAG